MKKLLTIVLSLVMVMSMTAVSFADTTTEETTTPTYTDMSTVQFTKNYKKIGGTTAVSPAEIFEFENIKFESAEKTGVEYTEDWAKANLPSIDSVSYEKNAAGSTSMTGTFTVTLPTKYPAVGIYKYSFNEKDKGTEGVTYNSTKMYLVVTVVQDGDSQKRIAAIHCEGADGTKTNQFDNTYAAGSLIVAKNVNGIFGDRDRDFEVTVTFTATEGDTVREAITYANNLTGEDAVSGSIATDAWKDGEATAVIQLKHGESIQFDNIPEGVTYTVEETDETIEADRYEDPAYASSEGADGEIVGAETEQVTITNEKEGAVDTGIILDNGLYIVLLAGALVAAGMFFMKRRQDDYDM